jgi:hypothetical protein
MMACSSTMGGCPFTLIIASLDLTSAATFCSLGDAVVTGLFPSGNLGEQVAVTKRGGWAMAPARGAGAMAARFNTLLGAAGAGR